MIFRPGRTIYQFQPLNELFLHIVLECVVELPKVKSLLCGLSGAISMNIERCAYDGQS